MLTVMFAVIKPAAALDIPTGLQESELDDVAKILGFNTSNKFLSNPYPLGGYSGLEVGVSLEIIDVEELSYLGNKTDTQSEFRFNRITVGKGIYNNFDIYLDFVPFSKSNQVSEYGGMLKWGFYQAKFLPFSAAMLAHMSTINIQDSFVCQNVGGDMMVGVNVNHFSLYFGGGYVRASTLFTQSILGFTVTGNGTYKETFSSNHSFVGVNLDFLNMFVAGQIDRYVDPVYSVKLGIRL